MFIKFFSNIATTLAIKLIWLYQKLLSPFLRTSCRSLPTCSAYAKESFQIHGFWFGLYLTIRRLLRCHPFCDGGFDPVPRKK
ncbi:MAG: membrane protein insertion efficiency factor YidD [bacterium]|nr:membrane protein insertion efficiency factor YidD [bacterium]